MIFLQSTAALDLSTTDLLINLVITLFILSVIVEKLTTLIRDYPRIFKYLFFLTFMLVIFISLLLIFNKVKLTFFVGFVVLYLIAWGWGIYNSNRIWEWIYKTATQDATSDKIPSNIFFNHIRRTDFSHMDIRTEKEVGVLSILVGLGVAIVFKADMISFFSEAAPEQLLGWEHGVFEGWQFKSGELEISNAWRRELFYSFPGLLITGFFLSFGSKFFHDLLDLLFKVKNLKRIQENPQTYQFSNIEDFDEYFRMTQFEIIEKAIKRNKHHFERDNVQDVLVGTHMIDGMKKGCAIVHLADRNQDGLPGFLPYEMSNGQVIRVPVHYVFGVEIPKVHALPGDSLQVPDLINPQNLPFIGTFGCVVQELSGDRLLFGLTCNHVVNRGRSQSANSLVFDKVVDIIDAQNPFQTKVYSEYQDNYFDIALLGPLSDNNNLTNQKDGHLIKKSRALVDHDFLDRTEVLFFGQSSGMQSGKIIKRSTLQTKILYNDQEVEMMNLILIGKQKAQQWSTISEEGDSGSVVFEAKTGKALGMIVAGSTQYTYMMPIHPILNFLDVEIAPHSIS